MRPCRASVATRANNGPVSLQRELPQPSSHPHLLLKMPYCLGPFGKPEIASRRQGARGREAGDTPTEQPQEDAPTMTARSTVLELTELLACGLASRKGRRGDGLNPPANEGGLGTGLKTWRQYLPDASSTARAIGLAGIGSPMPVCASCHSRRAGDSTSLARWLQRLCSIHSCRSGSRYGKQDPQANTGRFRPGRHPTPAAGAHTCPAPVAR